DLYDLADIDHVPDVEAHANYADPGDEGHHDHEGYEAHDSAFVYQDLGSNDHTDYKFLGGCASNEDDREGNLVGADYDVHDLAHIDYVSDAEAHANYADPGDEGHHDHEVV
ncbi:hypothetical protein, partial [Corynebacterium sp. HMSC034B08]|uniref:hypothetical protein n=1 Tax=Corynebacterium sp. HMSC034B08 TaxID=1715135 RepID=UPI001AEF6961